MYYSDVVDDDDGCDDSDNVGVDGGNDVDARKQTVHQKTMVELMVKMSKLSVLLRC